jgi:hypothetical protein
VKTVSKIIGIVLLRDYLAEREATVFISEDDQPYDVLDDNYEFIELMGTLWISSDGCAVWSSTVLKVSYALWEAFLRFRIPTAKSTGFSASTV